MKVDMSFFYPYVLALVRHALGYGGGYLVATHVATPDQSQAILGGLMAVFAILWSLVQKAQQESAVKKALYTPVPKGP